MAAYVPPEGYKPPTKKGTSTAVGKGNQAAAQREGESDDAYNKRKTQWQKSYDARGGVKLKDMNAGQLNKYVSSGGANRATNVSTNLGRFVGATTPTPPPPASSNTPTQGPSSTPQSHPPGTGGGGSNPGTPHQGPSSAGASASGGSRQNRNSPLGNNAAGAGAMGGLSQMPGGRRGRRRARQAMRRGGM